MRNEYRTGLLRFESPKESLTCDVSPAPHHQPSIPKCSLLLMAHGYREYLAQRCGIVLFGQLSLHVLQVCFVRRCQPIPLLL